MLNQFKSLNFSNLHYIIKKVGFNKFYLTFGIILSVLGSLVQLTFPLFAQNLIDGFSTDQLSTSTYALFGVIALAMVVLNALGYYLLAKTGHNMVANLRIKLWDKIVTLPVNFFDNNISGNIVSVVMNDTNVIYSLIVEYVPNLAGGFVSIAGSLLILSAMDQTMTLLLVLSVPFLMILYIPIGIASSKISKELHETIANLSGVLTQGVAENRLMKYSTAESYTKENGKRKVLSLYKSAIREGKLMSIIGPVLYLAMFIIIFVLLTFGGIQVSRGLFTIGELIAYLLYVIQIIAPLMAFINFFTYLMKAEGATGRIIKIFNKKEEDFTTGVEVDITNHDLIFEGVKFRYDKSDVDSLKGISFKAPAGQKIALVGPSGGGKTTIFSLIERFYSPNEGQIFIGEKPLNDINLSSWRKQLGYVSQDNAMISGTIRDNLYFGLEDLNNENTIGEEEMWEALELAHAKEFVEKLNKQLDSEIGERGVLLSGGQKQRINIARAFLRNPKILLLDEATANLDSQSEASVIEGLKNLMSDRTTFVIAHRLSTIIDSDLILFIEGGQITGSGTHEELKASHPIYQSFAENQLK